MFHVSWIHRIHGSLCASPIIICNPHTLESEVFAYITVSGLNKYWKSKIACFILPCFRCSFDALFWLKANNVQWAQQQRLVVL